MFILRQLFSKSHASTHLRSEPPCFFRTRHLSEVVRQFSTVALKDSQAYCPRVIKWLASRAHRIPVSLPFVPGFVLGSTAAYFVWKGAGDLLLTAQCKGKHGSRNRLSHHDDEETDNKSEPKFQWDLFFQLVWTDIFYLLGAVLVSSSFTHHKSEITSVFFLFVLYSR